MDPLTGLVLILAGAAMVKFVVSPSTEHALDTFAAGFMPYRDWTTGWPRGVQEEEPVAWSWSAGGGPGRSGPDSDAPGSSGVQAAPELVDIDSDGAPATTRVDRHAVARGMARRQP